MAAAHQQEIDELRRAKEELELRAWHRRFAKRQRIWSWLLALLPAYWLVILPMIAYGLVGGLANLNLVAAETWSPDRGWVQCRVLDYSQPDCQPSGFAFFWTLGFLALGVYIWPRRAERKFREITKGPLGQVG